MAAYPMVEEIDRFIGNLLAEKGELFLPSVGSLFIQQATAKRVSKTMVLPPHKAVEYSSLHRGESLVVYISQAANCSEEKAEEVYNRWLGQTQKDNALTISGVGRLTFKHFTPTDEFFKRLNPEGCEPVKIKMKGGMDWVMGIGIAAIVLVIGFGTYYFTTHREEIFKERPEAIAHKHGTSKRVEPTTSLENTVDSEQGEAVVGQDEASQQGSVPMSGNDATMETGSEVVPQQQASVERMTEGTPDAPARMTSQRKYVVLGVFSSQKNIERAISTAKENHPSWQMGCYQFGENTMVSAFSSDDEAACREFIKQATEYPDMWVYTAR